MPHAENELVKIALQESKDFSKSIRQYLYNMSKERQLTDTEKELYELTHEIHVRTNDALLILNEQVIETVKIAEGVPIMFVSSTNKNVGIGLQNDNEEYSLQLAGNYYFKSGNQILDYDIVDEWD